MGKANDSLQESGLNIKVNVQKQPHSNLGKKIRQMDNGAEIIVSQYLESLAIYIFINLIMWARYVDQYKEYTFGFVYYFHSSESVYKHVR